MRTISFFILLTMMTAFSYAQSDEAEKYHKESEAIRKEVWAWDKPQFKVREIPQQFAGASKIIIAKHTEVTAESKSKLAFYGFTFGGKKELTISEVAREVVKVNDRKAVDEYSQLSFTMFAKASGFFTTNKSTTYVGIRVIKPDGSIKEINGDDIVLTKDESKEKTAKLAVPDLAPGDILDYFIATEQSLTNNMSQSMYQVLLFGDAPIMHTSFHAQLGKKYAIEYGSFNGAPDLSVEKNADKEIIVDVEQKNIAAFETSLWVTPAKQLPFIKMYISLGYRGIGGSFYNKPGEVIKSMQGQIALDEKAAYLSNEYHSNYWMRASKAQFAEIESKAISRAKKLGISFKSLSADEKAAFIFYTFRFDYLLKFNIDRLSSTINIGQRKLDIDFLLFCMLKVADLDPAILVTDSKTGYRATDAMSGDDLLSTTYLPKSGKFVTLSSVYNIPFDTPEMVEGARNTKSITFDHPAAITTFKRMASLSNIEPGKDVPAVEAEKNLRLEKLKLSIVADKPQLAVKRTTILKGYYKTDLQQKLILYEDFYENERKLFGEKKSLLEDLESDKKGIKIVDEVRNAFAVARNKQKEEFIKDVKYWFEQEVTDLTDYKIENMGVRHTAPDFIYGSTFNLGGLVKKGGNNIILEIGKIPGSPLAISEDQRKRSIDVYMPFARSIEYEIELEIPEGYTVEGVSALNVNVENETGFFKVDASSTDKQVRIIVKKMYRHSFEPVTNFDKLTQFVDASGKWANSKLLLKKK